MIFIFDLYIAFSIYIFDIFSSLNPVATKKLQQSVVNIPNTSLNNLETASTLTSVSASSNQNIGSQSSNKKPLPK